MTILTVVRPRAAPPATRPGRAPEESFQKEEFEEEELLLLVMMGITLLLSSSLLSRCWCLPRLASQKAHPVISASPAVSLVSDHSVPEIF